MANEQNLIPGAHRLTVEEQSKGGEASGKERRRKANLRRAAKELLEGVYPDRNGEERTGEELVMLAVFANATEPASRNWAPAIAAIMELMGEKQTPEQKKKLKAETELLRAKAAVLRGEHKGEREDDGFLESLAGTAAEDWADEDEHL